MSRRHVLHVLGCRHRGRSSGDEVLSARGCNSSAWFGFVSALHSIIPDVLTGPLSLMRPNTPHYVLMVDNSITLGRHFYCTSTIRDTCFAHIHTGIMLYSATNTNHAEVEILLRRLFAMAADDFKDQGEINGKGSYYILYFH